MFLSTVSCRVYAAHVCHSRRCISCASLTLDSCRGFFRCAVALSHPGSKCLRLTSQDYLRVCFKAQLVPPSAATGHGNVSPRRTAAEPAGPSPNGTRYTSTSHTGATASPKSPGGKNAASPKSPGGKTTTPPRAARSSVPVGVSPRKSSTERPSVRSSRARAVEETHGTGQKRGTALKEPTTGRDKEAHANDQADSDDVANEEEQLSSRRKRLASTASRHHTHAKTTSKYVRDQLLLSG